MAKSMRLGGGGRFAEFKKKLEGEGYGDKSAGAIAASEGRHKYGSKHFEEMGKKGKLRKALAKRRRTDRD